MASPEDTFRATTTLLRCVDTLQKLVTGLNTVLQELREVASALSPIHISPVSPTSKRMRDTAVSPGAEEDVTPSTKRRKTSEGAPSDIPWFAAGTTSPTETAPALVRAEILLDELRKPESPPICLPAIDRNTAFAKIPGELVHYIFTFLDSASLARCTRVCRYFFALATDSALWRAQYLRRWLTPKLTSEPNATRNWRAMYIEKASAERLWRSGRWNMFSFDEHHDEVIHLQFDNIRLITSSSNSLIEWDPRTFTKLEAFTTANPLRTFSFSLERLALCDGDCVRVFDVRRKTSLFTLGALATVTCVKVDERVIALTGWDGYVKLWNASDGQPRGTLAGHNAPIYSLDLDDASATVATGSSDKTAKVWDLTTQQCTATLKGHSKTVNAVQLGSHWGDRLLFTCSKDTTVKAWDLRTKKCLHTLHGHTDAVTCMQTDGEKVVSGGKDGGIRVWNLAYTGQCWLALESAHAQGVNTLQFDERRILSGGADKMLKLWQFGA